MSQSCIFRVFKYVNFLRKLAGRTLCTWDKLFLRHIEEHVNSVKSEISWRSWLCLDLKLWKWCSVAFVLICSSYSPMCHWLSETKWYCAHVKDRKYWYMCLFRLNLVVCLNLCIKLLWRIKIKALQRSLLLVSRDMSPNKCSSSNKKNCKLAFVYRLCRNLFRKVVRWEFLWNDFR